MYSFLKAFLVLINHVTFAFYSPLLDGNAAFQTVCCIHVNMKCDYPFEVKHAWTFNCNKIFFYKKIR